MKRNKELFRLVIDLYVNFYQQITSPNFSFRCSNNDAVMIDKFIAKLNKIGGNGIGEIYLVDYFEFAFNYWLDVDTSFGGKIMLSWIIGDKAFQRWNNRDKIKFKYQIRYQLKSKVKIRSISRPTDWKEIIQEINDRDEIMKDMFFNTTKGFIWCYNTTSLYNHKSSLCSTCKNAGLCKDTLKKENFSVFKLRGYEENKD